MKMVTKKYIQYVLLFSFVSLFIIILIITSISKDDSLFKTLSVSLLSSGLFLFGTLAGLFCVFEILKFDVLKSSPVKTYITVPIFAVFTGTLSYFFLGCFLKSLEEYLIVSFSLIAAIYSAAAIVPAYIGNYIIVKYLRYKYQQETSLQ